jgi:hypothetical protein
MTNEKMAKRDRSQRKNERLNGKIKNTELPTQ